jgi:hypothetical protein
MTITDSAAVSVTDGNMYGPPKLPTPIRFRSLDEDDEARIRSELFGGPPSIM